MSSELASPDASGEESSQPNHGSHSVTVVISVAGRGTRLGLDLPKCLIEVGGRSLIEWQFDSLVGVDVVVVVGFKSEDVIAHVERLRTDVRFAYNPDYESTGTAASLAIGARQAGETVISLDGDLLVADADLRRVLNAATPAVVGVTPMSTTTAVGASYHDGTVQALGFDVASPWEWSGLLRMPREAVVAFGRGHVFESLLDHLPLPATEIDCVEIDEPEDLAKAEQWLARQPVLATSRLDRQAIATFWKERATTGRTRWTNDAFLEFEQRFLATLIPSQAALLDLGSGFGELSRSVCPPKGSLLAVDHEPAFGAAFDGDSRFRFEMADVVEFATSERFDLILVFGVVTHLDADDESVLYRHLAGLLQPSGCVIVKNQCSDGATFQIDTYSEDLDSRYVGRYPSVAEQRRRLEAAFADVEVTSYPAELKVHADTSHVAFVCRSPRR